MQQPLLLKKCENSQVQSQDLRLSQWRTDEYGWPSKYNGMNCDTYFCNLADNKQIHPHWLKPIFMIIWWLQLMPSWPTTHWSAASHLTQSAAVKTSLLECSSILIIYLHQILKFVTLPLCLRRGNMRHQILNQQQASWNVITLVVKHEVLC